jgi:hypothetical protein
MTGVWIAGKVLLYKIFPGRRQYIAETVAKPVDAAFSFADAEKKITDPEAVKKYICCRRTGERFFAK